MLFTTFDPNLSLCFYILLRLIHVFCPSHSGCFGVNAPNLACSKIAKSEVTSNLNITNFVINAISI